MNSSRQCVEAAPFDAIGTLLTTSMAAGIPAKIMADRLGHSSVMLTLDTYSHVTPAMDHTAADLIAGLVPPATLPLASCEPRPEDQDPDQEERRQKARSDGVRRQGLEPRTRGLRDDRGR